MIRKITILLLISILYATGAVAQKPYVYGDLRSDLEKSLTDEFLASEYVDTALWVSRFNACLSNLKDEEDEKAIIGSLARIYENFEKIGYFQGCQRCIQNIDYMAEHNNNLYAYLQARILQANTAFKTKAINGLKIYRNAEKHLQKSDDPKLMTNFYLMMGIAFGNAGEHTICMKYLQKAIHLVDNVIRDPELHALVYYHTSLLYIINEDYERANAYVEGAITICRHEKYEMLEAKCHVVHGDSYRKARLPMLPLAYNEYSKAINILEKSYLQNNYFLAKAYNGTGLTLLMQKQIDEAHEYLKKALVLRKELNNKVDLAESYKSTGDFMKAINEPDSAEYFYLKSFSMASDCNYHKYIREAALELADIMEHKKNWEKAFEFKDIAYNSYETIQKSQNTRAVVAEEMKNTVEYEIMKNEEITQNNEKLKSRLHIIAILALISIISMIVTIVLLGKKKKKNQELREKKAELEAKSSQLLEQQEELRQQSEVLSKQNAELEKLSLVARQTDNCIFLTDVDGHIVWLNEAFTQHSGYNIDDYSDHEKSLEIMRTCNPEIKKLMEQIKITKEPITYTSKTFHKNGSEVWVQTTLSPGFDCEGNISQFIAVCSNITDLKHAQEKIAIQNNEINESLEYAKKIQDAIQAPKQFTDYVLGEYMEVNLPKNIVSGDFHWVGYKNNKTLFALGDCTGHGIPGGFMSMIEQVMLNTVLQEVGDDFTSATILNKLRERNIRLLHQRGRSIDSQDGMDASLFVFDRENMMLNYAAGYSIAYILRFGTPDEGTRKVAEYSNCQLIEHGNAYLIKLKPNRFPVGGHPKDHIPFNDLFFHVNDGDIVYTSSDGYVDQFGGTAGKKLNTATFERSILEIANLPMEQQKEKFISYFMEWKGINEQTDDVHIFATVLRKNF